MIRKQFLLFTLLPITLFSIVVDDISGLNKTVIQQTLVPKSIQELQTIIQKYKGPFSIAGACCSQGGHTIAKNGIRIDMSKLNKIINLDISAKTITVQTGARWKDIHSVIDPHNLSISVMQSYADFSVGGSLSVNAHGRYLGYGPLIETVKSIQIITADGILHTASRTEDKDLFYGAIGGYGGLGIITQATLILSKNQKIEEHIALLPLKDYFTYFKTSIEKDPTAVLHNADLIPPLYNTVTSSTWHTSTNPLTCSDRLKCDNNQKNIKQIMQVASVRRTHAAQKIRMAKSSLAMSSPPVVWRNYEAGHRIADLYCPQYFSTDLLQEYFIPTQHAYAFAQEMAHILQKNNVNCINISLRHVTANQESLLSWSLPTQAYAFVMYYEQRKFSSSIAHAQKWTRELIDCALKYKGTFYLPYQKYATLTQFKKAYPRAGEFFALKKKYDPHNRFSNAFLDTYSM